MSATGADRLVRVMCGPCGGPARALHADDSFAGLRKAVRALCAIANRRQLVVVDFTAIAPRQTPSRHATIAVLVGPQSSAAARGIDCGEQLSSEKSYLRRTKQSAQQTL